MIIYKRFFDIIIVLIFSPIILFLFFLVSIYLLIAISSPIFFVQMRAGKYGKPFKLYKFRTMANTMNQSNDNFEDERKRVLKSTYFLRLLKIISEFILLGSPLIKIIFFIDIQPVYYSLS